MKRTARLGGRIDIEKGKKAERVFDRPTAGLVRYLQIDDLRPDALPKYVLPFSCPLAVKTDAVIAWDGANAGTVSFGLDGHIGSTLAIVRPTSGEIWTPYLGRFLESRFDALQATTKGATVPHLSRDALERLELPLPPLPVQRRIAGILGQADRLRRMRRYALELGDGISHPTFLELLGDFTCNERRWPVKELAGLSDIASGVTKGFDYGEQPTVEVPYLRVANVQDGFLDLSEMKTIRVPPSVVEELRLMPGDVVMTEGGDFDKLGRGAVWPGGISDCIHQNHIFRVRLDRAQLEPSFFASFLRTPYAKRYYLRCSKQTTNLATINMTQLRATPVPVPPVELQRRYALVDNQHASMQNIHREALRQAEHLFHSLLNRYFGGPEMRWSEPETSPVALSASRRVSTDSASR